MVNPIRVKLKTYSGGNRLGHSTASSTDRQQKVKEFVQKYKAVFVNDLDKLKGMTGNLQLQDDSCPKFKKARQARYTLHPQVEKCLQRLQSTGVLLPVEFSDSVTLGG